MPSPLRTAGAAGLLGATASGIDADPGRQIPIGPRATPIRALRNRAVRALHNRAGLYGLSIIWLYCEARTRCSDGRSL